MVKSIQLKGILPNYPKKQNFGRTIFYNLATQNRNLDNTPGNSYVIFHSLCYQFLKSQNQLKFKMSSFHCLVMSSCLCDFIMLLLHAFTMLSENT